MICEVRPVDLVERRVERGGLARAGGAGDEQDAVRPADEALEGLRGGRREAQPVEGQEDRGAIQEPHDDGLAVHRRHGGHADVHAPAARGGDPDAPVLGQAPLGDVQLGHDLDAGGEGGLQPPGRGLLVVQQPVDAVAHAQAVLEGLDVDIGGVGGQRPVDQEIDQSDDGGLECHVAEVVDVVLRLGMPIGRVGAHALDDLLDRGVGPVGALDGLQDGRGRRDAELDGEAKALLEVVEQQGIRGIGRRERDRRAVHRDRTGHVLAQVLGRQLLEGGRRRRQLLGVEPGQLLLGRQRLQHILGGGRAHRHERLAEPQPLPRGPRQRGLEDVFGDDAGLDEDLPDGAGAPGGCFHGARIMFFAETDRQS
jgi:hypothetical protein